MLALPNLASKGATRVSRAKRGTLLNILLPVLPEPRTDHSIGHLALREARVALIALPVGPDLQLLESQLLTGRAVVLDVGAPSRHDAVVVLVKLLLVVWVTQRTDVCVELHGRRSTH